MGNTWGIPVYHLLALLILTVWKSKLNGGTKCEIASIKVITLIWNALISVLLECHFIWCITQLWHVDKTNSEGTSVLFAVLWIVVPSYSGVKQSEKMNALQSFKMSRSTHPVTLSRPRMLKTSASLVWERNTCVSHSESKKITVVCQVKLMSLKSIHSLMFTHHSPKKICVILLNMIFMKLHTVLLLGVFCRRMHTNKMTVQHLTLSLLTSHSNFWQFCMMMNVVLLLCSSSDAHLLMVMWVFAITWIEYCVRNVFVFSFS